MRTLSDGTQVLIRPIAPSDKVRLSHALARLSRATIMKRFLSAKPRLGSSALRYLTEVDGHDHIALVALLADDPDSIVAVARCVRLPDAPDTAEFAIVVDDLFQGRGLGSLLARELATAARAAGIRRFSAIMQSENIAYGASSPTSRKRSRATTSKTAFARWCSTSPPERLAR